MSRRPRDRELHDAAHGGDWWICETCGALVTSKNTRCHCGDEPDDRVECEGCGKFGKWACDCWVPGCAGWAYYDVEYPDEGMVGPFASEDAAADHARTAYPRGGFRTVKLASDQAMELHESEVRS